MKLQHIAREFKHHFPFTAFSTVAGIIIVAIITVMLSGVGHGGEGEGDEVANTTQTAGGPREGEEKLVHASGELFHVFHPIHVFFSAAATTAMFWAFDKKLMKSIVIGFIGSLAICGLSDIAIPFIGGSIARMDMKLHVCLIDHALSILPFAVFGILLGLASAELFTTHSPTIFSHSAHVFVSTMASILYLTSFGFVQWMNNMFTVFIIVVLAVLIPCCTSDIVFPLLFVKKTNITRKPS
jgi:hypothetical protein